VDTSLDEADARAGRWEPITEVWAPGAVVGAGDLVGEEAWALGEPTASPAAPCAGAVLVFSTCVLGDVPADQAAARLEGLAEGDCAGMTLAGLGDTDGDGADEMAVGAPYADDGADQGGAAYVVEGPLPGVSSLADAGATLAGSVASGGVGDALAGPGDLDGDGLDDLVVGAPYGEDGGRVYVVLGPLDGSSSLNDADAVLEGEPDGRFGRVVAGVGDTDGDGRPDLAATGWDGGWLFTDPLVAAGPDDATARLAEGHLRPTYEHPGAAGGDLDGDGFSDLALGNPEGGANHGGEVSIFLGPVQGTLDPASARAVLVAGEPGTDLGVSLASGVDADADGFDDLLMGARNLDGSHADEDQGGAWLLYGGER
jgi:hypothetical protein